MDRLNDTAKSSALIFGLADIPADVVSMRQQLMDMQHKQKVDALMAAYEEKVGTIEEVSKQKEYLEIVETEKSENIKKSVEETGKNDSILSRENGETTLRSTADPMADVFGAGVDSNPQEVAAFKKELLRDGVELVEHAEEALGYSPGLVRGIPGAIYVSEGASYSAWLHEMQHMRDDRDAGWLGMRIFADPDRRYQWEVRAYNVEIELALRLKRPDIADKLKENLEKERRKIYGESFD